MQSTGSFISHSFSLVQSRFKEERPITDDSDHHFDGPGHPGLGPDAAIVTLIAQLLVPHIGDSSIFVSTFFKRSVVKSLLSTNEMIAK